MQVPFVLSAFLIALASATCGAVALCLGTFFHFLQLFNMYKDYLKLLIKDIPAENRTRHEEKKKRELGALNFQVGNKVALCRSF